MKTCSKCGEDKPEIEFRKYKGKPRNPCLDCRREYTRAYQRKRRRWNARRIRIFYSENYYAGQLLEYFTYGEDKPNHRFEKQRGRFSKEKIKRTWCKDCCLKKRRYQARQNYPSDSVLEPWQRREVSIRNIQQWWDKIKSGEIELPDFMLTRLSDETIRIAEKKRDLPKHCPVWE